MTQGKGCYIRSGVDPARGQSQKRGPVEVTPRGRYLFCEDLLGEPPQTLKSTFTGLRSQSPFFVPSCLCLITSIAQQCVLLVLPPGEHSPGWRLWPAAHGGRKHPLLPLPYVWQIPQGDASQQPEGWCPPGSFLPTQPLTGSRSHCP